MVLAEGGCWVVWTEWASPLVDGSCISCIGPAPLGGAIVEAPSTKGPDVVMSLVLYIFMFFSFNFFSKNLFWAAFKLALFLSLFIFCFKIGNYGLFNFKIFFFKSANKQRKFPPSREVQVSTK